MPKKIENNLKKQALKKFGSSTSKRADKYVYGTLNKLGYMKGNKKTKKK